MGQHRSDRATDRRGLLPDAGQETTTPSRRTLSWSNAISVDNSSIIILICLLCLFFKDMCSNRQQRCRSVLSHGCLRDCAVHEKGSACSGFVADAPLFSLSLPQFLSHRPPFLPLGSVCIRTRRLVPPFIRPVDTSS